MTETKKPLRIQLALQGGGAKLFALIAAMEVVAEYEQSGKIEITRIAGTSAGAIVGGLYAAGVNPSDMRIQFEKLSVREVLPRRSKYRMLLRLLIRNLPVANDRPLRKLLNDLLKDALGEKERTFKSLRVPTFIIAADLATNGSKTYKKGDEYSLVQGLLDSSGLPFLFRTADKSNNPVILDGGLCENLPVDKLIDEVDECGPVVALSFLNTNEGQSPKSTFALALSLLGTAIQSSVDKARQRPGIHLIDLPAYDITTFSFEKAQTYMFPDHDAYKGVQETTRVRLDSLISSPPKEFQAATGRCEQLLRTFPLLKQSGSRRYVIVNYPYTPINEVQAMQAAISNIIQSKCGPPEDFRFQGHFDAIRRPELAVCNEAIYTFPFFLSWLRHTVWGVIPYGRQTTLGVFIHKSHPAYANLKEFDVTGTQGNTSNVHSAWILYLLDKIHDKEKELSTSRVSAKLFSIEGYLYHEIIPLLVLQTGNDIAQSWLMRSSSRLSTETIGEKVIPDEMEDPQQYDMHAMIVDLAERAKYDKIGGPLGYEVLAIRHTLNIPVGIGFSLLMNPALQKDNLWRELLGIARGMLSSVEEQLREVGIEFDSL